LIRSCGGGEPKREKNLGERPTPNRARIALLKAINPPPRNDRADHRFTSGAREGGANPDAQQTRPDGRAPRLGKGFQHKDWDGARSASPHAYRPLDCPEDENDPAPPSADNYYCLSTRGDHPCATLLPEAGHRRPPFGYLRRGPAGLLKARRPLQTPPRVTAPASRRIRGLTRPMAVLDGGGADPDLDTPARGDFVP